MRGRCDDQEYQLRDEQRLWRHCANGANGVRLGFRFNATQSICAVHMRLCAESRTLAPAGISVYHVVM